MKHRARLKMTVNLHQNSPNNLKSKPKSLPAEIKEEEMNHEDSSGHPFSCVTVRGFAREKCLGGHRAVSVPCTVPEPRVPTRGQRGRTVQAGRHTALGAEGTIPNPLHSKTQISKGRD